MRLLACAFVSLALSAAALGQTCLEVGGSQSVAAHSFGLLAADLDGDGRCDLASASSSVPEIALRFGQADGTLSAPIAVALDRPPRPRALAAADLDGDHDLDLAVGHDGLLTLLLRDSGGSYASVETTLGLQSLSRLAAGDVDQDLDLDLVATSDSADQLLVFANDGAGGFAAPASSGSAVWPTHLALADVDSDLDLDAWMIGLGDAFGPPPSFVLSSNSGSGAFAPSPPETNANALLLAVGDLEGDGDPDAVIVERDLGELWIRTNSGGALSAPAVVELAPGQLDVALADLDQDGDLDVVTTSHDGIQVVWSDGAASFEIAPLVPLEDAIGVAAGDVDGDGAPDLLVTQGYPVIDTLTVVRGDCPSVERAYCSGDGSGTACPCGNEVPPGTIGGCRHSFGLGGKIARAGTASLSSDTLSLVASDLPATTIGIVIQGDSAAAGGLGTPFGDGLLCLGGSILRVGALQAAGGAGSVPEGGTPLSVRGGVLAPGERLYQLWFRNSASYCTSAPFNLTNGLRVTWLP